MSKAMIIVNPFSGKRQAPKMVPQLAAILQDKYDTVVLKESHKGYITEMFAREACDQGFAAIYSLGGDGTLNRIVNGIAQKMHRPVIGVIPAGTVNNYARMLNMPLNLPKAIEAMRNPEILKVDTGKVNERYFISSISIGALPTKFKQVKLEHKIKYGRLAYVIEVVKILNDNMLNQFHLTMDGEKIDAQLSLLLIGQGNSLGGIPTFFPHNTVNDGKLNYVGLKQTTMLDKIALITDILKNQTIYSEHLIQGAFQEAAIALENGETMEIAIDGEDGPDFPLVISILPKHLSVFVPAKI